MGESDAGNHQFHDAAPVQEKTTIFPPMNKTGFATVATDPPPSVNGCRHKPGVGAGKKMREPETGRAIFLPAIS
jgi:hypothetical protein